MVVVTLLECNVPIASCGQLWPYDMVWYGVDMMHYLVVAKLDTAWIDECRIVIVYKFYFAYNLHLSNFAWLSYLINSPASDGSNFTLVRKSGNALEHRCY